MGLAVLLVATLVALTASCDVDGVKPAPEYTVANMMGQWSQNSTNTTNNHYLILKADSVFEYYQVVSGGGSHTKHTGTWSLSGSKVTTTITSASPPATYPKEFSISWTGSQARLVDENQALWYSNDAPVNK